MKQTRRKVLKSIGIVGAAAVATPETLFALDKATPSVPGNVFINTNPSASKRRIPYSPRDIYSWSLDGSSNLVEMVGDIIKINEQNVRIIDKSRQPDGTVSFQAISVEDREVEDGLF